MPSTISKKRRLLEFVAARGWTVIGETQWRELRSALGDIPESTIRSSGIPISPPWNGVNQHSIDDLESSLLELTRIYKTRPDLQRYCRDQVIAAKDRARWSSQRPRVEESRRRLKVEMVKWMLVWLDDPAMFETWMRLRRRSMG